MAARLPKPIADGAPRATSITLPADLYNALLAAAEAKGRSLNLEIRFRLKRSLVEK